MTNTLYIYTLEPIEKRYTKQWYNYFRKEFSKHFNNVKYIDGTIVSDNIKVGKFLDINQTNIWKSEQIIKTAKLFQASKIKDGDMFFFTDAWHYGITALKYMADLQNIKIKIFGYWHAGSYDSFDFTAQAGLDKWAWGDEKSWLTACNINFVATQYHKELIQHVYPEIQNIKVVGFPMDWKQEIRQYNIDIPKVKEDLVIFPHRVDFEKQPDKFNELSKLFKNMKFIKSIEVTKNKEEYYKLLARAKFVVSFNLQETYGIGTVEGVMFNCIPIVPDRLAYKEMYSDKFKYDDDDDVNGVVEKMLDFHNELSFIPQEQIIHKLKNNLINTSNNAIVKMSRIMKD